MFVMQEPRIKVFYSTPSRYLDAVNQAGLSWSVKEDDFFPYANKPYAYWTGKRHIYHCFVIKSINQDEHELFVYLYNNMAKVQHKNNINNLQYSGKVWRALKFGSKV